jgi:hypothetical protein
MFVVDEFVKHLRNFISDVSVIHLPVPFNVQFLPLHIKVGRANILQNLMAVTTVI